MTPLGQEAVVPCCRPPRNCGSRRSGSGPPERPSFQDILQRMPPKPSLRRRAWRPLHISCRPLGNLFVSCSALLRFELTFTGTCSRHVSSIVVAFSLLLGFWD